MADLLPTVKVSDLPTATDSFEGDFLVVDQSDATRKSTWSNVFSRFGIMRLFSFQDGGTLISAKDQVIDRSTNKIYQWTGAYPKLVPANSTPESTGVLVLEAGLLMTQPFVAILQVRVAQVMLVAQPGLWHNPSTGL